MLFERPEHFYLYNDFKTVTVPCRHCIGCKLKYSRDWAIRAVHEKQMHKHSCYITLTYAGDAGYSLDYTHWQRFMRRLRKAAFRGRERARKDHSYCHRSRDQAIALPSYARSHIDAQLLTSFSQEQGIRFYVGGEYGEKYGRPHWHALLYGIDFSDKLLHKANYQGDNIYTSQALQKLWPYGFSSIGELTFQSAAYVARYVMKKYTGDGNKTHYEIIDPDTGEIYLRKKEFNQMSRRGGLGSSWMTKYAADIYKAGGKVIMRGAKLNPPRYYDKLYKKVDQAALEGLKHARYLEALAQHEHHTPERLAVQELVTNARIRNLKRNLTNGD